MDYLFRSFAISALYVHKPQTLLFLNCLASWLWCFLFPEAIKVWGAYRDKPTIDITGFEQILLTLNPSRTEYIISHPRQEFNFKLYPLITLPGDPLDFSLRPLCSNSSMHFLYTVFHTNLKALARIICLTIRSFLLRWWSFLLFSWALCLIWGWNCREKLYVSHSERSTS